MFNDEMMHVRLTAIRNLLRIGKQFLLSLNENQLQTMLLALDDVNPSMRKVGYEILGIFRVKNVESIKIQIVHLRRNLKRFPIDLDLIFICFRDIGRNHPKLIDVLKDTLLSLDRRYLPKEIDLESQSHIAHLIMIFNAGFSEPSILHNIPHYTFKQAYFLKSKYPECFPVSENDIRSNSQHLTKIGQFVFLKESLAAVFMDVSALITKNQYSTALTQLARFSREVKQICTLEPELDTAVLIKEYTSLWILFLKIKNVLSNCTERLQDVVLLSKTLFRQTVLIESRFSGLNQGITQNLADLRLFSQVALVLSDAQIRKSRASSVSERLSNSRLYTPAASIAESMRLFVDAFALVMIEVPAAVKVFKGTVTAFAEPGLPTSLDCVHYVPVPVHFEGRLPNRKKYGEPSVVAIVVEFSNQAKVTVPIDPICIEPFDITEDVFEFTAALVLGDTSSIKCTVSQGYVSSDVGEMWVLEGMEIKVIGDAWLI
ncbi:hypothetical protein BDR26DRAFT_816117 [Obelidium mucronatum]|nr:hypothetical protein BDR26DRAFT_816117 [Obelidium mucronatum]